MANIFKNLYAGALSLVTGKEEDEDPRDTLRKQQRRATLERLPGGEQTTLGQFPKAVKNIAKGVAQGFARNVASAGLTAIGGQKEVEIKNKGGGVPGSVGRMVFGEPGIPLKSIETRIAEGEIKAKDIGKALQKGDIETFLSPNKQVRLGQLLVKSSDPNSGVGGLSPAGFLVGGMIFADFTPLGGGNRGLKLLANADNVTDVIGLLKKTGMADDVVKQIAPRIASETDEKIIRGILDEAKKSSPKTFPLDNGGSIHVPGNKQIQSPQLTRQIEQRLSKTNTLESPFDLSPAIRNQEDLGSLRDFSDLVYNPKGFSQDISFQERVVTDAKNIFERYGIDPNQSDKNLARYASEIFEADGKIPDKYRTLLPKQKVAGTPEFTKDSLGRFTGSKGTTRDINNEAGFIQPEEILESGRRLFRKLTGGQDESSSTVDMLSGRVQLGKNPTEQELQLLDPRTPLPLTDKTLIALKQTPHKGASETISKQVKDSPDNVSRVGQSLREVKTRLLEYVQNTDERVRQLVGRSDVIIDDASDPYLKMTLYPGRVGNKIQEANQQTKEIVQQISQSGLSRREISDYLVALHAPERNAVLGDGASGVTTAEAQQVLELVDNLPEGKVIKEIAGKVQAINNQTLDILRESGVISDNLYKTLRSKYKNHVPLNRIMDESDNIGQVLSGSGYDVRGTGIKTARGSDLEVADVLTNVITNYEQAVLRAEKNIVDQATLAFVRNNQDVVGDLLKVVKPKTVGKTFDDKMIFETTNDPNMIQLYEHGKKIWIKVEDPNLAVALRGVGKEKLGTMLNAVGTFTRLYSGLATRFNPEFFLPNKLRDLQETAVYLASQKDVGFKGALKAVGRDPYSIRDVVNSLIGKDTEGTRLYKELKELGGTTGGFGLSTRKKVELDIDKMEDLVNSKTKGVANRLVEYIDNWNEIFEDSTRLSVYKQALSQGISKDRASAMAKEASINFNRMGQGGPIINALWMFSNASIQGSTKMIRALKNPKVLGAVTVTVGTSVAVVNQFNDQVDPEWRNKVSKWDRLNGLPVVIPSTDDNFRYFTIPVSWGIKPIKVMADYTYDAVSGQEFHPQRMIEDTITAIAEAYNPAGGSDLVSSLVPTILDIPVELARNTSWYGGKIKPDYDPNAPNDIRYFSSLSDTATGRASINVSEFLQDNLGASVSPADIKYAFDQYVGGTGRSTQKIANVFGQVTGDKLPLDEYPLISRFYRERTAEEVGAGTGGDVEEIKVLLEKQDREKFKINKEAEKIHSNLKSLSPEQANIKVKEIKQSNPDVYKKIKEIANEEKLGLNYQDKLIKGLGVDNGERAKYIFSQVNKLQTSEEKNEYIKELKRKKLVSDTVIKQLKKLNQL